MLVVDARTHIAPRAASTTFPHAARLIEIMARAIPTHTQTVNAYHEICQEVWRELPAATRSTPPTRDDIQRYLQSHYFNVELVVPSDSVWGWVQKGAASSNKIYLDVRFAVYIEEVVLAACGPRTAALAMKEPFFAALLLIVLLHETSHAIMRYFFRKEVTPEGEGPATTGIGESGCALEEILFGRYLLSVQWATAQRSSITGFRGIYVCGPPSAEHFAMNEDLMLAWAGKVLSALEQNQRYPPIPAPAHGATPAPPPPVDEVREKATALFESPPSSPVRAVRLAMLAAPHGSPAASADMASAPAAVPSATALGKRRLEDASSAPSPGATTSKKARPAAAPVEAVKKQERRVTRSSLGGAGAGSREASVAESEAALQPVDPSAADPAIAGPSQPAPPPSEAVATDAPRQTANGRAVEKPLFRQLDDMELLPPRGARHAPPAEADTSDAFYLRLHRYPEVLEKRASRLERERLIHERSKLINELEELRGRTWVYAGTSAGGKAEEERQRKIREMQERLARYDALLPNQPRKSNFLNLSVGTSAAPISTGAPLGRRDSRTRTESPSAPGPSASRTRREPLQRPSTPVSASASQAGGGGTKIRIKFGAPSAPASPRRPSRSGASAGAVAYGEEAEDELTDLEGEGGDGADADRYTIRGELRKGPKRDRRAERARAEERKRLGLPPRASIAKALTGKSGIIKKAAGEGRRRTSRSYAGGDDEDELTEEGEDEDDELDEGEVDEWDGYDSETGRPLRPSTSHAAAPLVRKRLVDSFFHSAALRDAVMASHGPNARRASTRVAYAFGQRLPDAALLHAAEFEPRGGVAGDEDDDDEGYSRTTLEAMVQQRSLERHGESTVLLDGRVLPKSALDVWRDGPLAVSPARHPHQTAAAASLAASSSIVQDSASDAGSVATASSFAPAALPPARRNGALWAGDFSPSVSAAPSPAAMSIEDPPPPPPVFVAPAAQRPQALAAPPMSLSMPMQLD
ncbi:hypothetical protein JCM10449v2_002314 [Rhodotorula kratochvilovae]